MYLISKCRDRSEDSDKSLWEGIRLRRSQRQRRVIFNSESGEYDDIESERSDRLRDDLASKLVAKSAFKMWRAGSARATSDVQRYVHYRSLVDNGRSRGQTFEWILALPGQFFIVYYWFNTDSLDISHFVRLLARYHHGLSQSFQK
jgi:hypothetical protein